MTWTGTIEWVVAAALLGGCGNDSVGASEGGGSGGGSEGDSGDAETGDPPDALDTCPDSTPQGEWSPMAIAGAPLNNAHTQGFWVDGAFLALNVSGTDPSGRYDPCAATWTSLAAPPIDPPDSPIPELVVARVGSKVLSTVFSVEDPSRGFIYDIEQDAWTELALDGYRWQRGRELFAFGDEVIIVSGGYLEDVAVVDVVDATLTVSSTAEMFPGLQGAVLGATDAGIFVIGGYEGSEPTAGGALFELATATWTAIPAGIPARVEDAVWVDDRLFAWVGIEGSAEGEPVPADPDLGGAFVYDPVTSAWTEVALDGGPQPASDVDLVVVDGRVLVFGGTSPRQEGGLDVIANAAWWDPQDGAWTQLSPHPDAECRGALNLAIIGAGIFVSERCGQVGYDAAADAWLDLGPGVPLPAAYNRTYVHTGERWLAWGGYTEEMCDDGPGGCIPAVYYNEGAIYRP